MSDLIFADNAPRYWAAGLSAIPLLPREKKTVIRGWSAYAHYLPPEDIQQSWLMGCADGNIGCVMGPQSGLVALDIDTDDPVIEGVLARTMPPSPWTRVGKKGKIWIYSYSPALRTFRIDTEDGVRLFELLASGTQIVVPPSIHPDTGRAYHANCDLAQLVAERRSEIRPLPNDIEMIVRDALKQAGVKLKGRAGAGGARVLDFIPAGGRDTQMVGKAGLLARGVVRGERTLLEAIHEMTHWIENYTEKVWGDELSPAKGVQKLIEFILRDVTGVRKLTLSSGWDAGLSLEDKERLGLSVLGDEHRKWAPHEIITKFDTEMLRPGVSEEPDKQRLAAEMAARMVAGNTDLGQLEESHILRYLVEATNSKLFSLADLRRLVVELRKGEIRGTDMTEIAKAVIADFEAKGELRYHNRTLWQWAGSHWRALDEGEVIFHISNEYGSYPICKRSNDHKGVFNVIITHVSKELESSPIKGINFVNGFLTTDLELRAHAPEFGATYVLPYAYDPSLADRCPKWLRMLADFWGEDEDFGEKMALLQECMAVTLFASAPPTQKAFLLYGVPHSGKTQILTILRGLMPAGCISNIPPEAWNDKFLPAGMADKLLNVAGEISESQLIDGAIFKQIVDGQETEAQRKFQQPFIFKPKCAQWFAGNHLPKSRDSSEGFSRRFMILSFNKAFTQDAGVKVLNYGEMVLAEEREAIAAWAVQGLVAFKAQQNIYTQPVSHIECEQRLAEKNNSARLFISALQAQGRLRLGEQSHQGSSAVITKLTDLYNVYRSFCATQGGVPPASLSVFGDRMVELQERFGFHHLREKGGILLKYLTLVASSGSSRSIA